MAGRQHSVGTTLLELMIAVAILTTLMGGILVLFTGSMRAVRQGHQNMQAYEVARGALNGIEEDITSAFTARRYGDYYTFFGTRTAMTFVGVAGKTGDAKDINLSRVTYVLHEYVPEEVRPPNLTADQQVVFGRSFDTTMWVSDTEMVPVRVMLRALLRYVEPNVKDLNTFPGQWPDPRDVSVARPEDPTLAAVYDELRNVVMPNDHSVAVDGSADSLALSQALFDAKKRELWLRMLAGELEDPSAMWAPKFPAMWAEDVVMSGGECVLGKSAADYVLAENIVSRIVRRDTGEEIAAHDVLFRYGRRGKQHVGETVNAALLSELAQQGLTLDDLTAQEAEERRVAIRNALFPWDLYPNVGNDRSVVRNVLATTFNSELNLIEPPSLLGSLYSGTYDSLSYALCQVLEPNSPAGYRLDLNPFRYPDVDMFRAAHTDSNLLGDPLDPRLPELVSVDMRIMFESPYPGAPDFDRPFTTIVDVPSAFAPSASQDLSSMAG